MINRGEVTLIPSDAVRNSAPKTPTDAPRRGRHRERPDVATTRARSTRTPPPTGTTKRAKVPEPVVPNKSPEVLYTEIAAEYNNKAIEL